MPRGDKTGPRGQGPKTGRKLGTCAGKKTTPKKGTGLGIGRLGTGTGLGRGGKPRLAWWR